MVVRTDSPDILKKIVEVKNREVRRLKSDVPVDDLVRPNRLPARPAGVRKQASRKSAKCHSRSEESFPFQGFAARRPRPGVGHDPLRRKRSSRGLGTDQPRSFSRELGRPRSGSVGSPRGVDSRPQKRVHIRFLPGARSASTWRGRHTADRVHAQQHPA